MKKIVLIWSLCFMVASFCFFYPSKKGSIIILDGVCSSGKTTLADCLMKLLGCSYQKVSLDDYVADIFLAKKKLNIPQKAFIKIIHECRDNMYCDIVNLVSKGKNVLLDTVLSGLEGEKDVAIAFKALRGLEVTMILVYCPLPLVAERIEERNQKSFFEDKPKEMRSIAATLQFCNAYKIVESDNELCVGKLCWEDVELAYTFPDFVPKQDLQIFNIIKKKLLSCFCLFDKKYVKISPRLTYDYIIDAHIYMPEQCAKKVHKVIAFSENKAFKINMVKYLS